MQLKLTKNKYRPHEIHLLTSTNIVALSLKQYREIPAYHFKVNICIYGRVGEKVAVVLVSACAETPEGACSWNTINLVARGVWIYSGGK